MAGLTRFRRAPFEALVVWQCVALAGVVAALAVAPAAVASAGLPGWATAVALALSAAMLARLLWSGHRVGTRLRSERRRHRELVDALGTHDDSVATRAAGSEVRVLAHPTPTAYCLPGRRQRVVLTEGTLLALPADELSAVLAHERAHLQARHDLVLEFFTVLHEAVPPRLRAVEALREVRLLVEVLADRAARRVAGPVPLARALVSLAGGAHPETALGATDGPGAHAGTSATRDRMLLLTEPDAPLVLRVGMLAFAVAVLATPVLLLVVAVG
ncbi:M56 family metallopeptidase [Phycicoccus sp. Soil748]|uniref:M56 family metallopeptidase n=1 Tax=Phycicoccus sp. Soil748 TaxID=1736397 RepID=UPI0009EB5AD3|nr:M56 family metallopeptidase [Phycicoccus sp. Soil748]